MNNPEVLSLSDSRAFLDTWQEHLEAETLALAKANPDPGQKDFLPMEPKDLLTYSEAQPEIYLAGLERIANIAREDYEAALRLVQEMISEEGHTDPEAESEAVAALFFRLLSEVYAKRQKARNDQEREKMAERIFKGLMKEAPYFEAASRRLGFDRALAGMKLQMAISQTAHRATRLIEVQQDEIEVEVEATASAPKVVGLDFAKRTAAAYDGEVEEEPGVDPRLEQVKERCQNFIDARVYHGMMIGPFQASTDMRIARARMNTGLSNLGEQLCSSLQRYVSEPNEVFKLDERALLTELAVIMHYRDMADLLDSYQKQVNQQAFVMYCSGLIRLFLNTFRAGRLTPEVEGEFHQIPYTVEGILK